MSYQLFNQSTLIQRMFSRQCWSKALQLAKSYGWRPLGTQPPSTLDFHKLGAEWSGSYFTNDGQAVRTEDAFRLACALETSLQDIPDRNLKMDWSSKFWLEDDLPEWLSPDERAIVEEELEDGLLDILGMPPLEYFAGDEKQRLKEFIRFCRLGSFLIL